MKALPYILLAFVSLVLLQQCTQRSDAAKQLETLQESVADREEAVQDSLQAIEKGLRDSVKVLVQIDQANAQRVRDADAARRVAQDALTRALADRAAWITAEAERTAQGDSVAITRRIVAPGMTVDVCLSALNAERAYSVTLEERVDGLLRMQGLLGQRVAVAGQMTESVRRVEVAYRVPVMQQRRRVKLRRWGIAAGVVAVGVGVLVVR